MMLGTTYIKYLFYVNNICVIWNFRCPLQIQRRSRSGVPSRTKCPQYDVHLERVSSGPEGNGGNAVQSHRGTSENPKRPAIASEEDSERRLRKIFGWEVSPQNLHKMTTVVYARVGKKKNWQLAYFRTFTFKTSYDNSDIISLPLPVPVAARSKA